MTLIVTATRRGDDVCYFGEKNGIFYVVHRSGNINAYVLENVDQPNPVLCRLEHNDMKLTEKFLPGGFIPSKANDCLYIGCRICRCIYHFDVGTDDSFRGRQSRFVAFEEDNEQPQSLSVTPDGRLVVLVAVEDFFARTWRGRLDIFNENWGALQASVDLPQYVENPWCVAFSDNNTFTVSYGSFDFGIIRLDITGDVVARSANELWLPRGVDYVSGCESIFVADAKRHLLLELNLELKIQRVVHDWKGRDDKNNEDKEPMRFAFNSRKTYAIVGMRSGRVNVYKIHWKM